jgi:hypothetical protein
MAVRNLKEGVKLLPRTFPRHFFGSDREKRL